MADKERITFNQAWKEFLLVRPYTRRVQLIIYRNTEKRVNRVVVTPFKLAEIDGEQYIVDDVACLGFILAFPKKIVEEAINKKIIQKLAGKTLSDEQLQIIQNKLSSDLKKQIRA